MTMTLTQVRDELRRPWNQTSAYAWCAQLADAIDAHLSQPQQVRIAGIETGEHTECACPKCLPRYGDEAYLKDQYVQPQPVAQGEAVALSYGDVPDKRTWEEKVRIMREAVGRWIVLDQGLWKVTKTDFVEGWRPANEKPQAVCDLEFMMGPLTKKNLSGYHVSIDDLAKSINPGSPHSPRTIITTAADMPSDAVDEAKVFEDIWKESTEIGVISRRAAEFVWHSAIGYARSYATPTIPTGHRVVPDEAIKAAAVDCARSAYGYWKGDSTGGDSAMTYFDRNRGLGGISYTIELMESAIRKALLAASPSAGGV